MSTIPKSQLKEYVQRSKEFIEKHPDLNETSTKAKLITPLVKLLGWDMYSDVVLEYGIRIGSRLYHVDYAFMLEDAPVLLLEAKSLGTDITEDIAKQVISYGRVKDIKWVAVANGNVIEIYDAERGSTREACKIKTIHLADFLSERDMLALISKEYVKQGETDKIVKEWERRRNSIRRLKEEKEEISESIDDILKGRVHEEFYREIEELTPAFIDKIITRLDPGVTQPPPESEDGFKRTRDPLETDKIEIRGTRRDIQFAKDILIKTANYLFNEGELDPSTDVPIASGRKRYIVNTESTHKDGESFYNSEQLDCGLYLETHNSADQSYRNAQTLMNKAGLQDDQLILLSRE